MLIHTCIYYDDWIILNNVIWDGYAQTTSPVHRECTDSLIRTYCEDIVHYNGMDSYMYMYM